MSTAKSLVSWSAVVGMLPSARSVTTEDPVTGSWMSAMTWIEMRPVNNIMTTTSAVATTVLPVLFSMLVTPLAMTTTT